MNYILNRPKNYECKISPETTNTLRTNYPHSNANATYIADFRNDEGLRVRKEPVSPNLTQRRHSETDVSTMPPLLIANTVTPDAYLARGERERVNGKAILTSMCKRRIRRLTPKECERLQGFPDDWTEGVSDTQRYKAMGNAVSVPVIKALGEEIIKL